MSTFFKTFIFLLFISVLHGCGSDSNTPTTYATTIGEAASFTRTDEAATITTESLKSISSEVTTLVKNNITELNEKEAMAFDKETNYCDISGVKESNNSGDMQKISSTQYYNNCQEDKLLQHGKLNIDYMQLNEEGKYPHHVQFTIGEDYTFNKMNLKKDLTVVSDINYKNQDIKKITVKINGQLTYDTENYKLQNITQSVEY